MAIVMIEILGTLSHSGLKTHILGTRSNAFFREYGNGRTYSGGKLKEIFSICL
jgi:hypothetical protein